MRYINHKIFSGNQEKKFSINSLCIYAFIARICVIALIYLFNESLGTNYVIDDGKYEAFAQVYVSIANKIVDVNAYDSASIAIGGITSSYLWFWFVCIIKYTTNSILIVRITNAAISAVTVNLIYRLTKSMVNNDVAKLAAKLFAFLPYPVIVSCFIIKDHIVTLSVLYIIFQIHKYQIYKNIEKMEFIKTSLSLLIIFNLRSGLAEILIALFVIRIIVNLFVEKRYLLILSSVIIIGSLGILLLNKAYFTIGNKIEFYMLYGRDETAINFIRVNSVSEIYKIPFAYLFAIIQPLNIRGQVNSWLSIIAYLNISLIPIAIGNLILLFQRKNNKYIYWTTLLLFIGTVILSLGIARHYYFMLPFTIINFSSFYINRSKATYKLWIFGTILLFVALVVYYGLSK